MPPARLVTALSLRQQRCKNCRMLKELESKMVQTYGCQVLMSLPQSPEQLQRGWMLRKE
jgi:hypothetical protein